MIQRSTLKRAFYYMLFFVSFNILFGRFVFNEKMDAYHIGGDIFRGVGLAILFAFLYRSSKKGVASKSE